MYDEKTFFIRSRTEMPDCCEYCEWYWCEPIENACDAGGTPTGMCKNFNPVEVKYEQF